MFSKNKDFFKKSSQYFFNSSLNLFWLRALAQGPKSLYLCYCRCSAILLIWPWVELAVTIQMYSMVSFLKILLYSKFSTNFLEALDPCSRIETWMVSSLLTYALILSYSFVSRFLDLFLFQSIFHLKRSKIIHVILCYNTSNLYRSFEYAKKPSILDQKL